MINILKLRKAKDSFVALHPKIASFFKEQFSGGMIEEGTVIEVKIKKPGKNPVIAKLTVSERDNEILKELKS